MIIKQSSLLVSLVVILLLTGCSNTKDYVPEDRGTLLPMSNQLTVPFADSGDIRAAMRDYFESVNAPKASQYSFVRLDLNSDHLKDALVYVKTPYGHWCGMNGCRLLILRAHIDGFSLVGNIENVRPPFHISSKKHNRWNDIIIEQNGRLYEKSIMSIFEFDGLNYSPSEKQPHSFSKELIESSLLL